MQIKTLGKNQTMIMDKNVNTFFSYDTQVIKINSVIWLYSGFDYSVTTNKYTNLFLRELGYNFTVADIKKAMKKDFKIDGKMIVTMN